MYNHRLNARKPDYYNYLRMYSIRSLNFLVELSALLESRHCGQFLAHFCLPSTFLIIHTLGRLSSEGVKAVFDRLIQLGKFDFGGTDYVCLVLSGELWAMMMCCIPAFSQFRWQAANLWYLSQP